MSKSKWLDAVESLLLVAGMMALLVIVALRWNLAHTPETVIDEVERPAAPVLSAAVAEIRDVPVTVETAAPEETPEPVIEETELETAATVLSVTPEQGYDADIPLSEALQIEMRNACNAFDVPYALALAITEAESSFYLDADSGVCWGPMQIHPCNYGWLRERGIEPTTYAGNIQAGVLMISQLLSRYGDTHLALMAYNAGEGGAQSLWAQGIYSSAYSRQITSRQAYWQDIIDN